MKTTTSQFALFRAEALKWISFFGLDKQWNIKINLHPLKAETAGQCWTKYGGKIARIVLNTHLPKEDYDNDSIRKVAFHEVCELLLSEINGLAGCRFGVNEEELNRAMHCVIRTLESTVFK